jgi:hypothetical protein
MLSKKGQCDLFRFRRTAGPVPAIFIIGGY